jgi:hypothetical protein
MEITFSQLREKYSIEEDKSLRSKKTVKDPPPVLILKRTGIRIFPTGEHVALYYNPALKMTFSVPYNTDKTTPTAVAEENLLEVFEEQNIDYCQELTESQRKVYKVLGNIVNNNQMKQVNFENNARRKVDVTSAKAVLELADRLTPENRNKLHQLIAKTPEHFSMAATFAFKNL